MRKIDESKARWMVREKRKETPNNEMAKAMKVFVRRT